METHYEQFYGVKARIKEAYPYVQSKLKVRMAAALYDTRYTTSDVASVFEDVQDYLNRRAA